MALKLPAKIGDAIDRLKAVRDSRKDLEGQIAARKQDEQQLEEHIATLLQGQHLTTGRGKLAQFTIVPKTAPQIEDWTTFWAYLVKTKNGTLVQKRIGVEAWRELTDDGKRALPGVTVRQFNDYSLTAVRNGS